MSDEKLEIPAEGTWRENTQAFVDAADWLGDADKPQIKALFSIADALDSGKFQAALISQYTLVHRGLMPRLSGGKGDDRPDDDAFFEKFGMLPGDVWKADQ